MCGLRGGEALAEYTDTSPTMGLIADGPLVAEAKRVLITARTTKLELVSMMHIRDTDGKTDAFARQSPR